MDFLNRTSGPAHRTDGGDESPTTSVKSPEELSEDQSPHEVEDASPIHTNNGDIEASIDTKSQESGIGRVEQAPERVLISEEEEIVFAPSPKKASSTCQNSGASDDDTVVQENQEDDASANRKDIRFLIIALSVLVVLILIAGSFLVYFFVQPESTEQQLKDLGFPYRKDMKNGWLFDANTDTVGRSYTLYEKAELGEQANEVGCATKCASDGAFAGAWNTYYQECWCYLDVPNADYCFERCIIEEGFEFSSIRLQSSFEWCPKSYCDIFEASGYCESRPRKNVTDCLLE